MSSINVFSYISIEIRAINKKIFYKVHNKYMGTKKNIKKLN